METTLKAVNNFILSRRALLTNIHKGFLIAFVLLVSLDLGSKLIVTRYLNFNLSAHQVVGITSLNEVKAAFDRHPQIDIAGADGKWLKLFLVFNDRFIFGSGPSAPVLGLFLTFFAILFLLYYRLKNPELGHPIAWLLIFSGAVGNLIDKLFVKSLIDRSWSLSIGPKSGYVSGVVDFIETNWFGWNGAYDYCIASFCPLSFLAWPTWPTFNFADSYIVVGVSMLVVFMIIERYANPSVEES